MAIGLYGKIPARGDFLSRRLPREFIDPWDRWLQSAIAASQEQLGGSWLNTYLTSPIWRFALAPGLCGGNAWGGIMMPSVDRVGRYFPFTLAMPISGDQDVPYLFTAGTAWFERLEELALSTLNESFDLQLFDQALSDLPAPFSGVKGWYSSNDRHRGGYHGRYALHIGLDACTEFEAAFPRLSAYLLNRASPGYSMWASTGSDRMRASLLVCDGLPPVASYCAFLDGEWEHRGWDDYIAIQRTPGATSDNVITAKPALESSTADQTPASAPVVIADSDQANEVTDVGTRVRWESAARSDVGKHRQINEDAFLDRPDAGLWVVADGMGGHAAGNVASQMIVDALAEMEVPQALAPCVDRVTDAILSVNERLRKLAVEQYADQTIGSTVVLLIARGLCCVFSWAGDSRLYRYRDGRLMQLTHDHTLGDALAEQDLLSLEGVPEAKECNIITRAVGADERLYLDMAVREVLPGDTFLLCSDGLDKEVSPPEISDVLGQPNIAAAAQGLIDLALERDARDNVTVVIARAVPEN